MEYEEYADAVEEYFEDRGTEPLLVAWDNTVNADPESVEEDIRTQLTDRYFTTILGTAIARGDERTGVLVEVPSVNPPLKENGEPAGEGIMAGTIRKEFLYFDFGESEEAVVVPGPRVFSQPCLQSIPEYFGIEEKSRVVWAV